VLARRYNNAKREVEELVKRVRSQPPPPIPKRVKDKKEEQKEKWMEHLDVTMKDWDEREKRGEKEEEPPTPITVIEKKTLRPAQTHPDQHTVLPVHSPPEDTQGDVEMGNTEKGKEKDVVKETVEKAVKVKEITAKKKEVVTVLIEHKGEEWVSKWHGLDKKVQEKTKNARKSRWVRFVNDREMNNVNREGLLSGDLLGRAEELLTADSVLRRLMGSAGVDLNCCMMWWDGKTMGKFGKKPKSYKMVGLEGYMELRIVDG